jgi:TIR domain
VSGTSHAVFLSYASQDAEAAQKICEALRAGGIEVFLDQSELRGGDVWDQKIRRQIHDCALFIPVISASTASRREGYFRLEWDLADQRSDMMVPAAGGRYSRGSNENGTGAPIFNCLKSACRGFRT